MPSSAAGSRAGVMNTIINSMVSKTDSYKEGVGQNHSLCRVLADRLTTGGGLKEEMIQANQGGDDEDPLIPEEDLLAFFEEQENRLKKLAENNAGRDRKIDAFAGALVNLQGKVADNPAEEEDYETMIKNSMQEEMARFESGKDIKDSDMCKEIRGLLGEKDASGTQEDDDDIEVMRNDKDNENKCKCPLTATWMHDPVKNKTCGHAYSREGIMAHIQACRGQKALCPFPGCDHAVEQKNLEDDLGLQRLVKRMKRRMEAEEEQRKQSQVMEDMDEDDE